MCNIKFTSIAREEMTFTRDGNDTGTFMNFFTVADSLMAARKLLNRSRHFEKENTELEKQVQQLIWKLFIVERMCLVTTWNSFMEERTASGVACAQSFCDLSFIIQLRY